jgi:hypothetical protein
MTCLAEKLIKDCTGETPLTELAPKTTLTKKAKSSRRMKLPGKKSRQKTAFFYKNAYILGKMALEKQYDIAILFRDTDGTQSTSPSNWKDRANSILDGFKNSGFQNGVAMVPKPTSEAWILCCLQKYQNCEKLEELPGNESSSKHPKKMPEQVCNLLRNVLCLKYHKIHSSVLMRTQTCTQKSFYSHLVFYHFPYKPPPSMPLS